MPAIKTIRRKLQRYPELRYDETSDSIIVHPPSSEGFAVALYQRDGAYTVSFAGWHEEFNSEGEVLNCFAFGLSEECRLRVLSRGRWDYRWIVQHIVEGAWQDESETGLIFFPFWLPRRERILQNHAIKVA